MAGSATVATKSYNNKVVVYTKRGNATCESHYDYYTALKSCDKREAFPIFIVPSIKDKILKLNNVFIIKNSKNKTKQQQKQNKKSFMLGTIKIGKGCLLSHDLSALVIMRFTCLFV